MALIVDDTRLVRSADLVASEMDGDLVMMDMSRGEYYGLGGVGPRLWALLEQPHSLAELVDAICREYAVEASVCRADILGFLEQLAAHGAVRRC